jgi:REP element-mobilizing transposase RayT
MARPLRIELAGGWYHVTNRGNERKAIYRDGRDRGHFLELVEETTLRFRVRLHSYVLMENHYHLMVELTDTNLSRAIQWLNISYSVWFNRRHRRSGHLFQGRFKSVLVNRDEWALSLSRYVHLNPVRLAELGLDKRHRRAQSAGLSPAPDAAQVRKRLEVLRSHRWSSYRAYAGLCATPTWLECDTILSLGGGRKRDWHSNYRAYVESAVREGLEKGPWESLREQAVLGGEKFLAEVKAHVSGDAQEQRGAGRLLAKRPSLAEVIQAAETLKGQRWDEFRDRYGDTGRDMVLYLGRRLCGLKLTVLAQSVGLDNYAVVAASARRYEERLKQDAMEKITIKKMFKLLNYKI